MLFYMNLEKYKWKFRLILIETPDYKNSKYLESKKIYDLKIKEFHKRYLKKITIRNKNLSFKIKLIGFDGTLKKTLIKMDFKKIFNLVDKMPMSKYKPENLSLYADYNKETTIKGLGFKNKEKAIKTLEKIKNKPMKYQINVVNTMIGRAENHPYKNKDMLEAVKVFKKWLKKNKK